MEKQFAVKGLHPTTLPQAWTTLLYIKTHFG
jgi:hypothetical protein